MFNVIEIEEYRCTLPLDGETDVFPVGFGLSFNMKNKFDFGRLGDHPPSPLVFILTDSGLLVTFFAVNMDFKNKSICYEPKQLAFKPTQQNSSFYCIYSILYELNS